MPRTLTLNCVRGLRDVVFTKPDAQGNSTAILSYAVCRHSTAQQTQPDGTVLTVDVYEDAPQSAQQGTVSVPVLPTDTTLTVMGKLQAAALAAEGLDATKGDTFHL